MKTTAAALACIMATATAFVPSNKPQGQKSVALNAKSQAIPFAERPAGLDTFKLAGDKGFDPLGLASSKEKLIFYRQAEVKHSRLAMLAALGWVFGELSGNYVVNPGADGIGLEPSLLNGGLGAVPAAYWVIVLGWTAALELQLQNLEAVDRAQGNEKQPGDYGFDPLGFFPKEEGAQMSMFEKEIKHGRLAMVAIVGFAAQEFVNKMPVAEEFRLF
mmetsp:Transcript_21207/g.34840  ORF Transcript_21207/g.34840 Transcript_21207/m.34840 type:complete len:217 (-) Transcript_21207:350-1000(-)